jgi:hypothetical protein
MTTDRRIVLDLPDAGWVFSTGDVSPFDSDYDCIPGIERVIEEVAQMPDLGRRGATIVLRLASPGPDGATLRAAIGRYCRAHAADSLRLSAGKTREGIQTLVMSAAFVVVTIGLVLMVERTTYFSPLTQSLLSHALVIAAWVAIWRPLDLLLYEPWLLRRRARIFSSIEAMPVMVEARGGGTAA